MGLSSRPVAKRPDADASRLLPTQARALLRRVTQSAHAQGRQDVLDEMDAAARQLDDDSLVVVVCGEANRGKSSLLNALLDQPGLLPVSAEVPTARHVAIRRCAAGEPETATARLMGREPLAFPLDELADWVAGDGPELARHDVSHVEVAIEHPLLSGNLVLVDTPGVGGLDRGHGEAALAALRLADAVLFVADSRVPISAIELEFLERVVDRVDAVVIVLNGVDHATGWREIRAADEALLTSRFGRGSEPAVVALSARMKLRADRLAGSAGAPAEVVEDLRRGSGVPELRERLQAWSGDRAAALRTANLCRLGQTTVARLAAAERAVLESSEDSTAELMHRAGERKEGRQELAGLARHKRVELQDRMNLLGRELDARVNTVVGDVRRVFQERVSKRAFKGFEEELEASLLGAAEEMLTWLDARLATVADELAAAFSAHDVDPLPEGLVPGRRELSVRSVEAPRGKVSIEELLSRAPFVFAALAIGNPLYALAALVGVVMHRRIMGGRARQEQYRAQLTETVAGFGSDLRLVLHEAVTNTRSALVSALDDAVAQRTADLGEEIRALEALASRGTSDRTSRRATAQERVDALQELSERLEALRRSASGALRGPAAVEVAG